MSKLTQLSSSMVTVSDGDLMHMVDISDTTSTPQGTSKKLTVRVIRKAFGDIYEASLSIPTASVLTLYTTPLDIVAAPGSGYAIQVVNALYSITYNSVAYATNTRLQLITDTASVPQGQSVSTALAATVSQISDINAIVNPTGSQTKIIENKSLKVQVSTGNPTAGNSDIRVYVFYRIITL